MCRRGCVGRAPARIDCTGFWVFDNPGPFRVRRTPLPFPLLPGGNGCQARSRPRRPNGAGSSPRSPDPPGRDGGRPCQPEPVYRRISPHLTPRATAGRAALDHEDVTGWLSCVGECGLDHKFAQGREAHEARKPRGSRSARLRDPRLHRFRNQVFSCVHDFRLRNGLSWRHDLDLRDKNPVSNAKKKTPAIQREPSV